MLLASADDAVPLDASEDEDPWRRLATRGALRATAESLVLEACRLRRADDAGAFDRDPDAGGTLLRLAETTATLFDASRDATEDSYSSAGGSSLEDLRATRRSATRAAVVAALAARSLANLRTPSASEAASALEALVDAAADEDASLRAVAVDAALDVLKGAGAEAEGGASLPLGGDGSSGGSSGKRGSSGDDLGEYVFGEYVFGTDSRADPPRASQPRASQPRASLVPRIPAGHALAALARVLLPRDDRAGGSVSVPLRLVKSPTQEEFIRGAMTKNPYDSAAVGAVTMRDVKNFICASLDMHGLCDDDYGMELLVAGRIASLDLLVLDVYESVWKPHVAASGGRDAPDLAGGREAAAGGGGGGGARATGRAPTRSRAAASTRRRTSSTRSSGSASARARGASASASASASRGSDDRRRPPTARLAARRRRR